MRIDDYTGRRIWLVSLLVLSGCQQATDVKQVSETDRSTDDAAIRSLLASNFQASTAKNAAGVANTFMADGDGWIAGLSRVSTRDAIQGAEEEFGGLPGFQSYGGTITDIRYISRDAAIVELSGITTLDTGQFDEETTIVVARTPEGWKIAAWRVMNFDQTLLNMLRNNAQ